MWIHFYCAIYWNELDLEDRKKVEEWIVANEENRQYYQAYQKTHLELRWMERSKKIEGNFIQFDRLRRKQHFRRVFYRSVACAVILLSVGGAFRYWDEKPEMRLVQEGIQFCEVAGYTLYGIRTGERG